MTDEHTTSDDPVRFDDLLGIPAEVPELEDPVLDGMLESVVTDVEDLPSLAELVPAEPFEAANIEQGLPAEDESIDPGDDLEWESAVDNASDYDESADDRFDDDDGLEDSNVIDEVFDS